ncbi:MAG: FAD-binding oxidoreductase [Gemmatimonadales bacterium]|nr:MAG: FAD-binding oxidoreductase [Gemmatimonadales bacterium]
MTRSSGGDCPHGFRGGWLTGDDAHRAAGRISGPFRLPADAKLSWAEPRDLDDLVCLLEWSRREGRPLIARGGGTGMPGGNLGPGVVVSLQEGFGEVRPARASSDGGGTMRVGSGVIAGRVEEVAASRGLTLPCLPSSAPWATIGGMVANNAAGARSFGHGAIHCWVEALEGVDANGTPFRCSREARGALRGEGGSTGCGADHGLEGRMESWEPGLLPGDPDAPPWPSLRKNSSGYALDRVAGGGGLLDLLVGSEGTLALLTGVTLRLAPAPGARGVHLLPAATSAHATELALAAADLGASACEFLGRSFMEIAGLEEDPVVGTLAREARALFLLEFEGTPEEVDQALDRARELGAGLDGPGIGSREPELATALWELRRGASPMIAREARRGRVSTQFIEDCVVPPEQLGSYLEGLEQILAEADIDAVVFGHAGDGNVHVNPLVPVDEADWEPRVRRVLDQVVSLVTELGGTLAGEHGDGRLRAPFLQRIWGPRWAREFRELKEHFDPEGRLNPGVILPLEGQDPLANLAPRPRSWPV